MTTKHVKIAINPMTDTLCGGAKHVKGVSCEHCDERSERCMLYSEDLEFSPMMDGYKGGFVRLQCCIDDEIPADPTDSK